MADEPNDPNTDTTPTPAGTADQPASSATATAPGLTAEQVQQMIEEATRKAYDRGAADVRRANAAKQQPPKTETKPDQPKPATDDALSILALRDAFDDATGDLPLSAKQKKFLRDRVMKERPDDVASFVAEAVEVLGVKAAQPNTNTPQPANAQTPTQPKTSQPTPPGPAAVPDREGEPAFRAMSEEGARDMWQAYVRRKGAVPGNPYDPRNRQVWREMRKRFEAEASISSIQLGARRG